MTGYDFNTAEDIFPEVDPEDAHEVPQRTVTLESIGEGLDSAVKNEATKARQRTRWGRRKIQQTELFDGGKNG